MKLFKLAGFVIAALLLVPFAHADGGPVNMVFTGVNGANDGQYYVSPYTGTMNGQAVVLFCDDIKNEVTFGQQWQANVTNLGTAISTSSPSALGTRAFFVLACIFPTRIKRLTYHFLE